MTLRKCQQNEHDYLSVTREGKNARYLPPVNLKGSLVQILIAKALEVVASYIYQKSPIHRLFERLWSSSTEAHKVRTDLVLMVPM